MGRVSDSKYMVNAGWDSVPHLDEKTKRDLLASTPPYLREARSKGIPSMGAGAIYPISDDEIVVHPFAIPAYWRKAYALDVGWNRTAALWGAQDPTDSTIYLYSEHYQGQQLPAVHAQAIKARGAWIPGIVDPAARGRSQADGKQLLSEYRRLGLQLTLANNAVDQGIQMVWMMLSTGQLKIFSTLTNTLKERRLYHRAKKKDENGVERVKIVKKNDHCLHGETLVVTRKGRQRIADMVGTSGEVLTVGGEWAAYRNCRMTARAQETVTVDFADGSSVRCTPDHRFLTCNGWIEAIDLQGHFAYDAVSQSNRADQWKSSSFRIRFKNIAARDITCAGNISSVMARGFIAAYGKIATVLSQMASMSIIGMKTSPTTTSATSSCLQPLNICTFTTRDAEQKCLPPQSRPQPRGMDHRKGWLGTKSTMRISRIGFTGVFKRTAMNAAKCLRAGLARAVGFVQTSVEQDIGKNPVSMMSRALAYRAGPLSQSIGMPRKGRVAGHAAQRCVSVISSEKSDVYCLEVPSTHAFAVENGVVVHNCMDCKRYLISKFEDVAIIRPPTRDAAPTGLGIADRTAGY